MAETGKTLHLATRSGWYRFELRDGKWTQTEKALSFFSISCLQVDPVNLQRVIAGTENFGLFISSDDSGDSWRRPEPNVPRLSTWSMLPLPGRLLVGTDPAALFSWQANGSWKELEDVRLGALGGTFPPNPESAPRTRFLAVDAKCIWPVVCRGKHWDIAASGLRGAVLELTPGLDGRGALAATSEGEVMCIDKAGCRTIISGLPAINAMAMGA